MASVAFAPALAHTVGDSHRVKGLTLTSHFFVVPLDHWTPGEGATLTVHAREVVAADSKTSSSTQPSLIFLQGGPGFEAPRPTEASGWVKAATEA